MDEKDNSILIPKLEWTNFACSHKNTLLVIPAASTNLENLKFEVDNKENKENVDFVRIYAELKELESLVGDAKVRKSKSTLFYNYAGLDENSKKDLVTEIIKGSKIYLGVTNPIQIASSVLENMAHIILYPGLDDRNLKRIFDCYVHNFSFEIFRFIYDSCTNLHSHKLILFDTTSKLGSDNLFWV